MTAAARLFAKHGYEGVSFRDIARSAEVDPGLIYHYFDGKEALFLESLQGMFQPLRPSRPISGGPPEDLGERIVLRFLKTWASEGSGNPFLGILRACATSDRAAGLIRKFVSETVVPAVRVDAGPGVELRTALVGSQLFGLATARYLLRLEPLASMRDEEVARSLGPLLTATLLSEGRRPARSLRAPRSAPRPVRSSRSAHTRPRPS